MKYIIRPIPLCTGMRDMSQWTYRWNIGKKVPSTCYIWYLEGTDPVTIVDAGAQGEHFKNPEFPMDTYQTLEEGLGKYGLKPDDVKQVIVTHLHFDHIALASRYPHAVFIVQKKELREALNPHIFMAGDYNRDYLDGLNFRVIDGSTEIMPGLSVLLTPGHTPGGQSVLVDTEEGPAVIVGLCTQHSTFKKTPQMEARGLETAVCGLHYDCCECYDTLVRIKKAAEIIIPLHDPAFMEMKRIEWSSS